MSADAEKLIINDPAKAIEFFNKAREIYPETAKIDSRIELAQESLKTLRSSAEMKQKRDELEKEIVIDIEKITPPHDTSDLVSKLARLEQFVDGSAKARKLRNRLFDKYFKAISKELETSPKNARRILAYCSELNPDAPGLKQLEENIEAEILREEQRKKAEQQKLRAERLDTARNAIYTGIKKDKIPEDLNKIYDEIKALSRDYPESEVPIKLFSHLEDRCREEIESSKENTKALETIEICLSLFQDNDKFQAYLHKKKHAISENQKIIQQKKLIAKEYKTIDNFINSPSKNKIESLNNSLDKIASEISDQEAQKARNKVIQALEKDFSTSSSVDSAQNTIALLEALDSSFKGRSDQKISQLKKSKTDSLHKQISNFEPSTDTSRLIELLNNFDDWNAQNEKIQALQTIKQNYQQKINEIGNQKPAKAIDLIDAVSSLSGLNSDDDLKNTRTRLLKLTKEKKADQEIQKMVTAGKNYANNSLILENTDRQFEIITYLQKHSPENAKIVLDMTVKRLIDNAQSKLDKKQFDEAENYIRVARQFSPESQEAQRLQVQIVQKRKAMNKPKEFVVGRTGNFKSISAAVAAAESGVTIKIQPGNYSEKLNLNKAVILEGTSFDNCSLNYSNGPTVTLSADATIHNLTVTNTSKVAQPTLLVKSGSPSISDCIITNNTPAPQPDFTACIAISGGNPVFSNNRILSSRGMGITITAGSPIIKNNQISNCQIYGIWLNGSSKAIISGNKISSNDKSGIGVKNFAAPSFTTNIVEENGENGFLIYSNAKGKYEGNRISKNKFAGIEIWDAQPEQIKNNVFNGNNRNAIYIRGSKALARLGKNQFNNTRGEEIKNSGGRIQNL
jgi:parallel beta-helix repeat protein